MSKGIISIIDLIDANAEQGVVIKPKRPQNIINYADDEPTGNNFTEDHDGLNKEAIGLFDAPIGSPDGNYPRRDGDKYRQEDQEVADRFFGSKSVIDTEESWPPSNKVNKCNNKPINIPVETESEEFFAFLMSGTNKLGKRINNNLGEKMNNNQLELEKLANALRHRGHDSKADRVMGLAKIAQGLTTEEWRKSGQDYQTGASGLLDMINLADAAIKQHWGSPGDRYNFEPNQKVQLYKDSDLTEGAKIVALLNSMIGTYAPALKQAIDKKDFSGARAALGQLETALASATESDPATYAQTSATIDPVTDWPEVSDVNTWPVITGNPPVPTADYTSTSWSRYHSAAFGAVARDLPFLAECKAPVFWSFMKMELPTEFSEFATAFKNLRAALEGNIERTTRQTQGFYGALDVGKPTVTLLYFQAMRQQGRADEEDTQFFQGFYFNTTDQEFEDLKAGGAKAKAVLEMLGKTTFDGSARWKPYKGNNDQRANNVYSLEQAQAIVKQSNLYIESLRKTAKPRGTSGGGSGGSTSAAGALSGGGSGGSSGGSGGSSGGSSGGGSTKKYNPYWRKADGEVGGPTKKIKDHLKDEASVKAFRAWANTNHADKVKAALSVIPKKHDSNPTLSSRSGKLNKYVELVWKALGDLFVNKDAPAESAPQAAQGPESEILVAYMMFPSSEGGLVLGARDSLIAQYKALPQFKRIWEGRDEPKKIEVARKFVMYPSTKRGLSAAFDSDKNDQANEGKPFDALMEQAVGYLAPVPASAPDTPDLGGEESGDQRYSSGVNPNDFIMINSGGGDGAITTDGAGFPTQAGAIIVTRKAIPSIGADKAGIAFFVKSVERSETGGKPTVNIVPLSDRARNGGSPYLTQAERKAILNKVPYGQRDAWEDYFEQLAEYRQTLETGERGSLWWHETSEEAQADVDEMRQKITRR